MDDGMDYDVQTKVKFRLDFDGSGEFNVLLLPDIQKQFTQHVKKVYERDDTLGSGYVSSNLSFHFDGQVKNFYVTSNLTPTQVITFSVLEPMKCPFTVINYC